MEEESLGDLTPENTQQDPELADIIGTLRNTEGFAARRMAIPQGLSSSKHLTLTVSTPELPADLELARAVLELLTSRRWRTSA